MARFINTPLSASTVAFQYMNGSTVSTVNLSATDFQGGGGGGTEHGIPSGGTTGQALVKNSNTDYSVVWSSVGGIGSNHSHGNLTSLGVVDVTSGATIGGYLIWGDSSRTYKMPVGFAPQSDMYLAKTGDWAQLPAITLTATCLVDPKTLSLGSSTWCTLDGGVTFATIANAMISNKTVNIMLGYNSDRYNLTVWKMIPSYSDGSLAAISQMYIDGKTGDVNILRASINVIGVSMYSFALYADKLV